MNNLIFVTMYTETPIYVEAISVLSLSLQKFNLENRIYKIQDFDNWKLNTDQKASVILEAMNNCDGKDVVWIDADAEVKAMPELLFNIDCDIAYHLIPNTGEFLSGTLYLKNNELIRTLVGDWIEMNKDSEVWEQKNLAVLLRLDAYKDLMHYVLPASYCKIFDNKHQVDAEDIIVHYQASRRVKNK